jgi:hypothetical protein
MARRRRTKVGIPRKENLSKVDQIKQDLIMRAFGGTFDGPRYGFTVRHVGKAECYVFRALFAAKLYLSLILEDDHFDWIDEEHLVTEHGLEVKGMQLRRIYDYKLKRNEAEYFQLSDEYRKRALYMRDDSPRREFQEGESIIRKKRHSRKSMTKVEAIASQLGMSPRACRAILRRKMDKPEHGWAWRTQAEVDEVIRLLTGKNVVRVDLSKAEEPQA